MPNCAARFMDNNLAIPDTARITYSSQLSAFPASNAYNPRRSLVWKTGGNFTITSTNNKIYIYDGTNKTVTLTAGNYTYSTLATHIQTQLNASSSNWTVTYSTTTFKFTVTRTSGADGLRFSQTTDAAWTTLGFLGTIDDFSGPFVSDVPVNHTDEWYKWDVVTPADMAAFFVIWRMGQACPFSGGATIKIQMNNIDDWTAPPVDVTLDRFDRMLGTFFEDTDTVYRYGRFWFQDKRNPCGPEGFEIGHIYCGSYRTVTVSNVAPGISKQLVDQSVIQKSVSGSEYTRQLLQYRSFSSMEMQILDADERRALEQMISQLGKANPFYFCLDPLSEVTADLDEATFYAKFDRDPDLKNIIRDRYTLSFELRELV